MTRTIWYLGFAATAAFVVLVLTGRADGAPAEHRVHLLGTLLAGMLLLFSHLWIFLYLAGTARLLRETARQVGRGEEAEVAIAGFGPRLYPWLVLALIGALLTIVVANPILTRLLPGAVPSVLFAFTAVAQSVALVQERKVLAEHDRWVRDLGAAGAA